jgi:hypothetical protein
MLCFVLGPPQIYVSKYRRLAFQGVEEGSKYLHCSSVSRKRRRKGNPLLWGGRYTWATLFLGDINTQTCAPGWGNLKSETVKCGHESCGTWTWEWMRWWGPAAIINDKPILSSERMLHKDYDCRCSIEKKKIWPWVSWDLVPRRTDWW